MPKKEKPDTPEKVSPEITKAQLKAAKRMLRLKTARDSLIDFAQITSPHPDDPDDTDKSIYKAMKHHRALAAALQEVEKGTIPRLIVTVPPRHGKSIAHNEPVLTPSGWTTHGDLRVGDYVFGPDGKPVQVIALSPDVDDVVPVTLSNGETIRCHLNHEWTVFDRSRHEWVTLETRDILTAGLWTGERGKRGSRARFQLPDTPCVEFQKSALPLHPYVLGAWLGDGSTGSCRFAHHQEDTAVVDAVAECGYKKSGYFVQKETGVAYTTFAGSLNNGSEMQRALKAIGVLNDKHIPDGYLRSSIEQRLQLLAGLIDTDGHVEQDTGRCRFVTTSETLRDGVYDLCSTLGFRPYIVSVPPSVSSSGKIGRKTVYQVGFQPTVQLPTRLPRKQIKNFAQRRRVSITDIGPVEKGGARSIQVARDDGLYLVGRKLNVTHNTEIIAKKFIPWYMARDPYRSCIFATYNEIYAGDVGADVRNVMAVDPAFRQVFPSCTLRKGGTAKGRIQTYAGGLAVFVGRGGAITGRGADLLIIDDLLKDAEEAESPTIREKCWEWFTKVAMTRLMSVGACVVIVMTRWHEDDVVGRLTDPSNPCYSHEEAKKWKVINLPAIAEEDDPLGRAPGEVLWPERFSVEFLEAQKRLNPRGFSALYQQKPTPEDGTFFLRDWIQMYDPQKINHRDLRIFASSDHAIGKDKNKHDRTVLMIIGVDSLQNIYLLDCWIGRAGPDVVVERMIDYMQMYKPIAWWAEKGHISQSIGPFLYKRMLERNIFCVIDEVSVPGNKEQRAQAIRGRLAMKKIFFPRAKGWANEGIEEMMKFPAGRHDDFVDTLAYIGIKLMSQFGPSVFAEENSDAPKVGTMAWIKADSDYRKRLQRLENTGGF